MSEQAPRPQVFSNRFADAVGPGNIRAGYDLCSCFDYAHVRVPAREVRFHHERQDTSAPGWLHMLALIEEDAADGREVFRPLVEMSPEERRQVITVPPSVGKLMAVKRLVLYRSSLVWLPPEIRAPAGLVLGGLGPLLPDPLGDVLPGRPLAERGRQPADRFLVALCRTRPPTGTCSSSELMSGHAPNRRT